MAFSEETKDAAYERAGGQCECRRRDRLHPGGRCPKLLKRHGKKTHFNHRHAEHLGGSDGLDNCEVLCRRCHERTVTYGRH